MASLAEALAHQFPGTPGIRTREDGDGGMEIFDWPAVLGPLPTTGQIAQWKVDAEAARPPEPLSAEELYGILEAKGLIVEFDRPRPKPVPVE